MARVHGKNVNYSINGVSIEDELNSVSMNMNVPESEITSFSDVWQNFLAGKPSAQLDIQGSWDGAANQGDATIFGELGLEGEEWDFEPDGTTGYDGYAIVNSYSIQCNVNEAIKYSSTLRHNGGAAAADGAAPTRA